MIWILIAILLLLTAGLGSSVHLLYLLKRDTWAAGSEAAKREADLAASLTGLQADFNSLRTQFDELEQRSGMLVAPAPVTSGLNLTKRTQAMRMLARGENSEAVAEVLQLPRAETELLTKIRMLYG